MIHQHPTLEQALADFLKALVGRNRRAATSRAYQSDIHQFITWLHENNMVVTSPTQVERADITEYLASLADRRLSGVSRARKVAALREYFRYLLDHDAIAKSPVIGIETPRREKNGRTSLSRDEYTAILSLAGGSPRDFAILQVFLQTGIRVSELVALKLDDIDLAQHVLYVLSAKAWPPARLSLSGKSPRQLRTT